MDRPSIAPPYPNETGDQIDTEGLLNIENLEDAETEDDLPDIGMATATPAANANVATPAGNVNAAPNNAPIRRRPLTAASEAERPQKKAKQSMENLLKEALDSTR